MSWPGGAAFAVSVTVDVDGCYGLPHGGRGWEHRLSSRSERLYGLTRGLPRILALLSRAGVLGTFYVPGAVAVDHPDALAAIAAGGHEVGHHGHRHLRPDEIDEAEQTHELRAGLEALADFVPAGYRAPGWELTPATLRALGEHGFTHDSSLMGDDGCYVVRAGPRTLWELPVHWTLDDAPHFASGGDPAVLGEIWLAELRCAEAEGRHVTFTLHPEILGRPHRVGVLERLIEEAATRGAWLAPHAQVVEHLSVPPR
jgi:peptidoglycan/xylan/chitin deacetylase (PgdA/CDA1 family)